MRLYLLKESEDTWVSPVGLLSIEAKRLGLNKNPEETELPDAKLCPMHFTKYYSASGEGDSVYFDIHPWHGDLMRENEIWGNPFQRSLFLSRRIASLLEEFKMVPHLFYDCILTDEKTLINKEYVLLVLMGSPLQNLAYSEVSFSYYHKRDIVHNYQKGEIKNYSDYKSIEQQLKNESRFNALIPYEYIYNEKYNLIGGIGRSIVVDEDLKMAIESKEGFGFEIKPYQKSVIGFL